MSDVSQILAEARSAHARGDLQAAAAGYGGAAQLDPSNAELHYLLGTTRYALGDMQVLRPSLQEAIRLNCNLAPALHYLGIVMSCSANLTMPSHITAGQSTSRPMMPDCGTTWCG